MKSEVLTSLSNIPITYQRPVPKDLGLDQPHVPRVNAAPDVDHPDGSVNNKRNITVLQQHLEFFDRNKDGIIYPWETYAVWVYSYSDLCNHTQK